VTWYPGRALPALGVLQAIRRRTQLLAFRGLLVRPVQLSGQCVVGAVVCENFGCMPHMRVCKEESAHFRYPLAGSVHVDCYLGEGPRVGEGGQAVQ